MFALTVRIVFAVVFLLCCKGLIQILTQIRNNQPKNQAEERQIIRSASVCAGGIAVSFVGMMLGPLLIQLIISLAAIMIVSLILFMLWRWSKQKLLS